MAGSMGQEKGGLGARDRPIDNQHHETVRALDALTEPPAKGVSKDAVGWSPSFGPHQSCPGDVDQLLQARGPEPSLLAVANERT